MKKIPLFTRQGEYILLPQAINSGDIVKLDHALNKLLRLGVEQNSTRDNTSLVSQLKDRPLIITERDNNDKICRVEYLAGSSDFFSHFVTEQLQPWAEAVAGEPMVLFKDKCNLKLPGGGAFPPHQDITAYKHFGSSYYITIAISLDEATTQNGCLEFAPGFFEVFCADTRINTYKANTILPSYEAGIRNGDILDELSEQFRWITTPTKSGDIIIFDSYIPHRSYSNNSTSTRRMFFFTFSPAAHGCLYSDYYTRKRRAPNDPVFHISTPTIHSEYDEKPSTVSKNISNLNKTMKRLFTPGPLNTSRSVKVAAARDIGSRTQETESITNSIQKHLLNIADANENGVAILLQGSGTFALEATLTSLLTANDHLVIINNGIYARRLIEISEIHNIHHTILNFCSTTPIPIDELANKLSAIHGATHIAAVHFETGLGVLNDIEAITQVVHAYGLHIIIDAMSSFGALPIPWMMGCTAAIVTSSNKCLHGLPGIGIVICDQDQLVRLTNSRTLSLDLKAQAEHFSTTKQWRFTPPTNALLGLQKALSEHYKQGGINARGEKYKKLATFLIGSMAKLKINPAIEDIARGPMITTFVPDKHLKLDTVLLAKNLEASGLIIYPGKHEKTGSFRVGCMGEISEEDLTLLISKIRQFINKRA